MRTAPGHEDCSLLPPVSPDCGTAFVSLGRAAARRSPDYVEVDLEAWRADHIDWWRFDRAVDAQGERGGVRLRISWADGPAADEAAALMWQVALRCQRWAWRTTPHSDFMIHTVLPRYRKLHPRSRPLAIADWAHAVDTWQWTVAMRPDAGCAVQTAALLHDIERLSSEIVARREHLSSDYQEYKRAHAHAGAAIARGFLVERCDASRVLADRVADLVAQSDRERKASGDPEQQLLADADALSFFALNAPGFVDYYGPDHTRRKVAFTIARMSDEARGWLPALRLPDPVRAIVSELEKEER